MDTLRLFVALDCQAKLKQLIKRDFLALGLNPANLNVPAVDNLHLTLKFWSHFPLTKMQALLEVLDGTVSQWPAVSLDFKQAGSFGGLRVKALVLEPADGSPLIELFQSLEEALWQAGLAAQEVKGFRPHLTLARVKQPLSETELAIYSNWRPSYQAIFDRLVLFESRLTPQGSEYLALKTYQL